MKAMKRIALATVMMVGGMAVFAAENGDQVYNTNLSVSASITGGASVQSVIEQLSGTNKTENVTMLN